MATSIHLRRSPRARVFADGQVGSAATLTGDAISTAMPTTGRVNLDSNRTLQANLGGAGDAGQTINWALFGVKIHFSGGTPQYERHRLADGTATLGTVMGDSERLANVISIANEHPMLAHLKDMYGAKFGASVPGTGIAVLTLTDTGEFEHVLIDVWRGTATNANAWVSKGT